MSNTQTKWKECVKSLEVMKQRQQDELKPYEMENTRLHSENSSARSELDRLTLERESIMEKYNEAWRMLMEQKEYCKTHFKDLLQRVSDAEEQWEREKGRRLCLEQQLKHSSNELAGFKEMESFQKSQFQERHRIVENELKAQMEKFQELQYLFKQSVGKNENLSATLEEISKEIKLEHEVQSFVFDQHQTIVLFL